MNYTIPCKTISESVGYLLIKGGENAFMAESVAYYLAVGDSATVRLALASAPDSPAVRLALALAAGRRADVDRAIGGYQRTGTLDID